MISNKKTTEPLIRPKNIHNQNVYIDEIIHDLQKILKQIIGIDITLKLELGAGIRQINTNPNQLEQVLTRLVLNAKNDIREKGNSSFKEISIRTYEMNLNTSGIARSLDLIAGSYQVIEISSTVNGIKNEVQQKLIDPICLEKCKTDGSALEIFKAYEFVKQHGGDIHVSGEQGYGTVFKIFWPCIQPENTVQPGQIVASEVFTGEKETIMVVEDDKSLRALTKELLKHMGYQVILPKDGKDALKMIETNEHNVDLLFTDLMMPGINGKELAKRVYRKKSDIKILYTSGYGENLINAEGASQNEINFIAKPYTPDVLEKKIRALLDNGTRPVNQ